MRSSAFVPDTDDICSDEDVGEYHRVSPDHRIVTAGNGTEYLRSGPHADAIAQPRLAALVVVMTQP